MGAITSVPREVVPPVNHSPGFAVLCGSGILSQDIPSSSGLPALAAAGERTWRLLIPPASLLCSLPPSCGKQGGWGCIKLHELMWSLLLGKCQREPRTAVLYSGVWPGATQSLGYPVENKTCCCVRQPRLPSLAFPPAMSHPALAEAEPGSGGTGTSCPGSHCSLSWRKPSVGSCALPVLLCQGAATPQFLGLSYS